MARRNTGRKPARKRFTVSLELDDYERLIEIADSHRPRLTLQYVVQYAVRRIIEQSTDPKFVAQLGSPLSDGKK